VKRGSPIPFRLWPGKHKSGAPRTRLRACARARGKAYAYVYALVGVDYRMKSGVCFVRTKLSVISRQGTPISPRLRVVRHISAARGFFLALLSLVLSLFLFFSFHSSFPERCSVALHCYRISLRRLDPSLAESPRGRRERE